MCQITDKFIREGIEIGRKHIAVIPARSGSKGLKDKNIKFLENKPLMAYTIEAAKQSGLFDCIHFLPIARHMPK